MWILLAIGVLIIAIGVWTVVHPETERDVGGSGSSFSPGTRRVAGYVLVAIGMTMAAVGLVA